MRIGAIVQARMSSRRFPGKVLHPVAGRPMLSYLLDRLRHCEKLATVTVATSVESDDDAIEQFCAQAGVDCYRGPLDHVARRFDEAARRFALSAFVRVNGDSPLLDQRIVAQAVSMFESAEYDLVTNVFPRTFPAGQSVEVLNSSVFSRALEQMNAPDEREHVTQYFYKNAGRFRIHNFTAPHTYSIRNLSVDTGEDMQVFSSLVAAMRRPHWEYTLDDVVGLVEAGSATVKNA